MSKLKRSSTLPDRTEKAVNTGVLRPSNLKNAQAALQAALEFWDLKVNIDDTPDFKEARLVKPDPNAKKQAWVVKAWIYDEGKGRRVRKQFTYFNNPEKYPTDADKEREANKLIAGLNAGLAVGKTMDSRKHRYKERLPGVQATSKTGQKHFLIDEINAVLFAKRKLKTSSVETYEKYLNVFIPWVQKNGPIYYEDFTVEHWGKFFQYLEKKPGKKKIESNRTFNNYLNVINTFFTAIDENIHQQEKAKNRLSQKIVYNPLVDVDRLPEDEGRNYAFTKEQVKQLIDFMATECPEMIWPCLLMFNTFMRTNEINGLQLWQINYHGRDQIYLPPVDSKSRNNRWAGITPELQREIDRLELKKYNQNYYVIGDIRTMRPGPIAVQEVAIAHKFRRRVLDKLGYTKDFTFYSWKHTGITWAKLYGGLTDAAIFVQGGWKDWNSFTKYMKSLGLMDNSEFAKKMPSINLQ